MFVNHTQVPGIKHCNQMEQAQLRISEKRDAFIIETENRFQPLQDTTQAWQPTQVSRSMTNPSFLADGGGSWVIGRPFLDTPEPPAGVFLAR